MADSKGESKASGGDGGTASITEVHTLHEEAAAPLLCHAMSCHGDDCIVLATNRFE
jgi:hypothetical protein